MREQFWTRFGVRLEDLGAWPEQQITDYLSIMHAEAVVAKEQSQQQGNGGAASAEATQKAYEMMRAKAMGGEQGG